MATIDAARPEDTGQAAPHWSAADCAWLFAIGTFAACFLAADIGIALTRQAEDVASLWFANGIAFAILIRQPADRWLPHLIAATLASFCANLAFGDTVPLSAGLALANLLEILAAALIVRGLGTGSFSLETANDFGLFLLGAVIGAPAVGATIGAGLISLNFDVPFPPVFATWWAGDAAGMLITAPLILAWTPASRSQLIETGLAESSGILLATAAAIFFAFGQETCPLLFTASLPLVWAALRGGVLGVGGINTDITDVQQEDENRWSSIV